MKRIHEEPSGTVWVGGPAALGRVKGVAVLALVLLATLCSGTAAQPYLIEAQLEYQQSRQTAYFDQRAAEGLAGGALPAGEYAWTMEFRCETHEACIETFGFPLLPPWLESYTFAAHLTSDGTRMSYGGANVYRARESTGRKAVCEDPTNVPFEGTCVFGETAEAYVLFVPTDPPGPMAGRPLLWVRNAQLFVPLPDGSNWSLPCTCGAQGIATPTPAVPDTLYAEDFVDGRVVPPGVVLTVQLVKLP